MRPPRLLICGFGAFPAAPANPSAAAVEALAARAWRPASADAAFLTLPVAWTRSVEVALDLLRQAPAQAVLVVGVAVEAQAFRVETRARNLAAASRPDHDGLCWPAARIDEAGPPAHEVTAPAHALHAALAAAGLPVHLSDDAGDYLCNFTLFRLLAEAAAPAVGFLHVPQARECDPAAQFALDDIERAVRIAADALADSLRDRAAGRHTA